jgi:hydrogenase nickel incorporation protein HypB
MGRFHKHADGTTHANDGIEGVGLPYEEADPGSVGHGEHGRSFPDRGRPLGDHSSFTTGIERVQILGAIFGENDRIAAANRADYDDAGVVAVNLMSSPGAGKTQLLWQTLRQLKGRLKVGIVEGDIETDLDADRLEGAAAALSLVNTGKGFGGECHLDASMVRSALARLPLSGLDLLVIENVGNLVCPAEFSVGEHARAMVYAVTEGEEKPLKYPVMFRSVDLVVINKIDLLPHLDFDVDLFLANLSEVNPGVATIWTSARTGDGVDLWCDWLIARSAAACTPGAGNGDFDSQH